MQPFLESEYVTSIPSIRCKRKSNRGDSLPWDDYPGLFDLRTPPLSLRRTASVFKSLQPGTKFIVLPTLVISGPPGICCLVLLWTWSSYSSTGLLAAPGKDLGRRPLAKDIPSHPLPFMSAHVALSPSQSEKRITF